MAAADSRPWPTELRLAKDRKALTVTFDDGESFALRGRIPARDEPERRGAGPFAGRAQDRAAARSTSRSWRCNPVGNYAVRLVFDDLHSTGIYQLGLSARARPQPRPKYWQDYLDELAAKGMTREPADTLRYRKGAA